jgi:hypothetical protein
VDRGCVPESSTGFFRVSYHFIIEIIEEFRSILRVSGATKVIGQEPRKLASTLVFAGSRPVFALVPILRRYCIRGGAYIGTVTGEEVTTHRLGWERW